MARIPLVAARGAVREPQILSKGRVSQHAPAVARVAGDAGEKNLTTVPEVSRQIVQVARKWMDGVALPWQARASSCVAKAADCRSDVPAIVSGVLITFTYNLGL